MYATNPLQCLQCDKTFGQTCHLNRDMMTVHIKDRSKCKLCSKEFSRKADMDRHFSKAHAIQPSYGACHTSEVDNYKITDTSFKGDVYDTSPHTQVDLTQEVMDPTWSHPFTALVAGPTGSGKTVFVRKFLDKLHDMVVPVPEEIIWCYGEWQPFHTEMSGIKFIEGLPDMDQWQDNKRRLVVIDDLMAETDERVTKLFTKGSHHRNVSVMYLVQNLFGKNKEQRTISLNSHYIVLFKNPRDGSQIINLAKQMYPGQVSYLKASFKDATAVPYGYLLIDLRQETPDHMRLRTAIFPTEAHFVYVPK